MIREVGDVYLLHPLMVHSAMKNATRVPRVIMNLPVVLKEPFRLSWGIEAGDKFSLVEQNTLWELGFSEGLDGWKIEGGRAVFVPRRIKIQEEMKERECERLAKLEEGKAVGV
ncbi:hypothetical protein B0H14DRAFT_2937001 [Mycena olivaceomarginata]|nr:hypothetical protein B0H14DRAFT_2937001 [Mycena olivaceomarginata]